MSALYEGEDYDLEAAIAAVAADMHLDDWDDGPAGNWPDMERGLRTFDSEEDEAPEQGDPRRTKAMALTKHLQAMVQFATHKCCLAGKLPEGVRARLLREIELRVTAASKLAQAATLGLLALARWVVANIWAVQPGGTVAERLLAETPDGLTTSGLPLWNERLISQLMLGIATRGVHKTARPVPAVAELHALVSLKDPTIKHCQALCCSAGPE
jgi:hypothetical protein